MTIEERLVEIRNEMTALQTFLNHGGSYEIALECQNALCTIAHLSDRLSQFGMDVMEWPVPDGDTK